MKPLCAFALLMWLCPVVGLAAIKSEAVEYKAGDVKFEGVLFYDDADSTPRRAVMVCHEWWGLNDYSKRRAEQLAQMGYVAFAVDVYGKGVQAKTMEEARRMATALRNDRATLRARINAALGALKAREEVNPAKIAVIGYCFGGTTALELARSGAEVAGVVSFHGGLATPTPQDAKNIKAKVLVCHGADDPNVPMSEVNAFIEEMKAGRVNYQVNVYGGAVHTFTNPAAGNDPSTGSAYNERADRRSWEEMKIFFGEIFK
jgi:dienelactone hydrolase